MGILKTVSDITELNDLSKFLQDEDVDRAMDITIRVVASEGGVPPSKANALVAELQGLSVIFGLKATYYATIGRDGKLEVDKKNIYFTMKEQVMKLADAMKYVAKV